MDMKKNIKDMTKGELRVLIKEVNDGWKEALTAYFAVEGILASICRVLERIEPVIPEDHEARDDVLYHIDRFRAIQEARKRDQDELLN